jgi:hypothetical protein
MPSELIKEIGYSASGDDPRKDFKKAETDDNNWDLLDNLDMSPTIEPALNAEIAVRREAPNDPAVKPAHADVRAKLKQHIEGYRDGLRRFQVKRDAEWQAFGRASGRIRRIKRGWTALSDRELTATNCYERERARKARNKRDQRVRKVKSAAPAPATEPVVITRAGFNDRLARLRVWLALSGHRQRQLRGRETDIMRSWIVYQDYVARHGRRPSLTQFAGAFTARFDQPMTRQMAQKRSTLLGILMAAGGPLR